jgi:biopolymer transport protein ExbD
MRFTRRIQQRGIFDIVVTSMLDINFLLIMFFMMTAHFQRTTHAKLELPQEKGEENTQIDEAGLVINVGPDGSIVISGRTVDLPQLRAMVEAQVEKLGPDSSEPLKLLIRADRKARTADLNRVVTMLRELGVGTMRIATEIPA